MTFTLKSRILLCSLQPNNLFCNPFSFISSIYFSNPSLKTNTDDNCSPSLHNAIIDALHKHTSWKVLSENFSSVEFSELMVRNVMLQMKETINSRKALNFFHWVAKEVHLEQGLSNYCIMIHILVKARMVKDASALLESVLNKDFSSDGEPTIFVALNELIECYTVVDSVPFVFDLFMQTCAKLRMLDHSFDACKLLFDHGFLLSVISFNKLLHVSEKSGMFDLSWRIYEHMIFSRICPTEATMRIMVNALCKAGKLERLLNLVDKMHGKRCSVPRVIVNSCLIYEMIGDNRIEEGLVLLKWMLQKNMLTDTISCCLVVFAKVKIGDFVAAREIYDEMLNRGFAENAFVCSLYIMVYSEEGRIDDAIGVFVGMQKLGLKPNEEAFNQLIKGCCSTGRLDDGLIHCKKMVEEMQLLPSCSAVNEMFLKLCENGKTKQADEMLTILVDKGFEPDGNTYSHLVYGYGKENSVDKVISIQYEMKYRSISPTPTSQ